MEENTSKIYVGTAGLMNPVAPGNGAGSALFVINLCASIAPVQMSGKNLPGLDNYRLYQVSRVEDGRTRHRLRLGFFTSESHAESVLTVVRQQYPTAFTACLCDEDRRFVRGYLPNTAAAPIAPAPKRPVAVVSNPAAPAPPKQAAAAPAKPAPAPTAPSASNTRAAPAKAMTSPPAAPIAAAKPVAPKAAARAAPEIVEVTWEPPPAAKAATTAPITASKPKRSGLSADAGLDEFTWEGPALKPAAPRTTASTSDTAKHPIIAPVLKVPVVTKAAPAAKPVAPPSAIAHQPAVVRSAPKPDAATSMRVPALKLTLSEPPPVAVKNANPVPTQPFHVGKGVAFADVGISLESELPEKPAEKNASKLAAKASAPAPSAPAKATPPKPVSAQRAAVPALKQPDPARKVAPVTPAVTATPKAAAPPVTRSLLLSLPDLDSTQTIRALTTAELSDGAQEKWFAIQLAASEQPVNLDTMPHLDIFEAYRLYSVASAGSGKIIHSLRLGFFKEAVSAEAVGGYLKTFFGSPTVLRISVAEQARFKDAPALKKSVAAGRPKNEAKVVDLNNARARPVIPTVTMEVAAPSPNVDPAATGSFRTGATGSFKMNSSGTHKALTPGLKPAAKPVIKPAAPAMTRSAPAARSRNGATGKYTALKPKSLTQQLLDEAHEVELSESGIRKLPKSDSLLSRLVDKLTK